MPARLPQKLMVCALNGYAVVMRTDMTGRNRGAALLFTSVQSQSTCSSAAHDRTFAWDGYRLVYRPPYKIIPAPSDRHHCLPP